MRLHRIRFSISNNDPRTRTSIVLSWVVVAALMIFLGWSYFSNPKPGPYGVCYSNKGRNPCSPDLSKAGREQDLALTAKH
jgi:hypothetical protein